MIIVYGVKIEKLKDLEILRKVIDMNNEEKPNFTKIAKELGT